MRTIVALLLVGVLEAAPLQLRVQSESALLVNAATGKVLFAKNPDATHYPASLTKIATAIFALDERPNDLGVVIRITPDMVRRIPPAEKGADGYSKHPSYVLETDASLAGLKAGDTLTLHDLLYANLLPSGGDAANAIATYVGNGSIEQFMARMNRYLARLGCRHTTFCNPHGLFHPNHVTTCRDMVTLCRHAMKHPLFSKIVASDHYKSYPQNNKLVKAGRHFYPRAVGIKTGYVAKAQHTLAAAAQHEGRLLIAILMRCKERAATFEDARALFDAAFQQQAIDRVVLQAGELPFRCELPRATGPITTTSGEPLHYRYFPAEEPQFRCQLLWDTIQLPVAQGERVGEVALLADDTVVQRVVLYAQHAVQKTLWGHIVSHWGWILLVVMVGGVAVVFCRKPPAAEAT